MTKRDSVFWTLLVAGLSSPVLAEKVGPEFQVNTYTSRAQSNPSIAANAAGDFVVVWDGSSRDGRSMEIFGQRYDSGGNPLSGEFQVNTYTFDGQTSPSIASDAIGNFIVVWQSRQDGSAEGIYGQRYDSHGSPLGGEFHVSTYTLLGQVDPSVASDASGNFVVVWRSGFNQDGNEEGIFGQRFDSSGSPIGGEFQVNTYTTDDQENPAVAADPTGNFVVVWGSYGQDGSAVGVFGQRYDSDGNPAGDEFQVNTFSTSGQGHAAITFDANGDFVVVWYGVRDGSNTDIFGQRYDSAGNRLGGEFQVNSYTTHSQNGPAVASDASGNFVVVWTSYEVDGNGGQDGDGKGLFGQRYDSSGNRRGGEFRINTHTAADQQHPSVASDASGNFVVAWESYGQDGSSYGIFGQRFSAGCNAWVRVQGDANAAGTVVPVQVHIAHHRRKTVTVRWKLSLLDDGGQIVAKHISPPHTFETGDVLDQEVLFQLPDDLASGEYTLDLAIKEMAGTKGARAALRVVRAK